MSETETERQERFREGYYEYGEVTCNGCDSTIDLSDADDLDEAVAIWNDHVQSEHSDGADDDE